MSELKKKGLFMENQSTEWSSKGAFPSYKIPPVNEVVCGMRFQTPDKLRIPHVGLLWEKFRGEFPIIQHAPPVAGVKGEILILDETGLPLPRVWFINKTDDQLIQFQFDRFYFNWRQRLDSYPRYLHIIENFEMVLNTIINFFEEFELGELRPIEYELSYINHIIKGQGWNSINDLSGIFSDFVWRPSAERFLPEPVNIIWQADFPLPEKKGRLTTNLKQAIRSEDKVPLFVLQLSARGGGDSTSENAIREWFDLAHEWIVRGFTDLTTPEVQRKFWEREEDA